MVTSKWKNVPRIDSTKARNCWDVAEKGAKQEAERAAECWTGSESVATQTIHRRNPASGSYAECCFQKTD